MYEVKENDWKLFRERLPGWQEAYMERLIHSYIELLSGDGKASDKFRELEKEIRSDRQKTGVSARMSRSMMVTNILSLLNEGAITPDDLHGFSDDLTERIRFVFR